MTSPSKPLLLCGEAPGAEEDRVGASFVGPSGIELLRMLDEAEVISLTAVDRDYIRAYYNNSDPLQIDAVWRLHPEVLRANVFQTHPPGNDLSAFCGDKSTRLPGFPILKDSKYARAEFAPHLAALEEIIVRSDPNLIVALGNTALWALCGVTKIGSLRGTTREATHIAAGRKVLPIYHPAAVLRGWENRPVTIIDLKKAKREKEFPDVRRPRREIWVEPDLDDIRRFFEMYVRRCRLLSVDIETSGQRVTCIGFAPSADLALVIPFDDDRRKGRSYWQTGEDEIRAWNLIRDVLIDRNIRKVFQNGMYDIAFLWRSYGIRTRGAEEDTMLAHHALMPEMPKGLGFLGSVYCDEGPWKSERRVSTTKKDD